MDDHYTPRQLAEELGYDEARPGRVVRKYLREKNPGRIKYQSWRLTQEEADDVRRNVPRAEP